MSKSIFAAFIFCMALFALFADRSGVAAAEKMIIKAEVNGTVLTAELEDNSSAKALYEKLRQGSITVGMHDFGNFEKTGKLGFSLPTNDTHFTTKPGDIILYQGDTLVFYYDTNTWDFTRLGKFRDVDQATLKKLFGEGNITAKVYIEK